MDSLTQAVLGATVGEAVLGERVGRKAALWGALAGTIPDLDVLAYPLLDTAGELVFHRGITHGLPFSLWVGPLLGWLVWRQYRWRGSDAADGGWRGWSWLFFWSLVTHPLLDVFTIYGTQLLAPFSSHPFALGSVFIIDPLFTLPLLGFLMGALFTRQPGWRRRWAVVGLVVGVAYLGWGLVAQQIARGKVDAVAERMGLAPERTLVTPAPLTSLLWRAEIEDEGEVYELTIPLWGEAGRAWTAPPVPLAMLTDDSRGAEALRWFSRGWLVRPADTRRQPGTLLADARFGRGPDGTFVFRWRLDLRGNLHQLPFDSRLSADFFRQLARRAFGLEPAPLAVPLRRVQE